MQRSLTLPARYTSEQITMLTIIQCYIITGEVTIIRCVDSSENPFSPTITHTHTHVRTHAHAHMHVRTRARSRARAHTRTRGPSTVPKSVTITHSLAYATGHATNMSPIRQYAGLFAEIIGGMVSLPHSVNTWHQDTKAGQGVGGGMLVVTSWDAPAVVCGERPFIDAYSFPDAMKIRIQHEGMAIVWRHRQLVDKAGV